MQLVAIFRHEYKRIGPISRSWRLRLAWPRNLAFCVTSGRQASLFPPAFLVTLLRVRLIGGPSLQ